MSGAMGNPIDTSPPEAPSSIDPQTSTPTTAPPASPSPLPPAALDLAAKLFDYARQGSTPELIQYITIGIPPNLTNHSGDTLLMLASYHGHVDTVRALLANGADPNMVNERGQSIMAGAVFKGYEEVVRVLFEAGAEKGLGQPTAVDCARMFRREGMLELFGEEMGEGIPGITVPR